MAEPMDVIDVLTEDHRTIGHLLDLLDAEERPAEARTLFLQIVGEVAAHELAEQRVVYPALRAAAPDADADAAGRLAEHEEVNELLAEMRQLSPAASGFAKRASALILELRAHCAAEEESVFDRLRALFGRGELVAMAERVRAVKRCAPAFPEPERAVRVPTETLVVRF